MKICFVLASISGREKLLNEFIASWKSSKYCKYDIFLYYQDVGSREFDENEFTKVIYSNERDGVFLPRYRLLKETQDYDYTIILDDDVEMRENANFEKIIELLEEHPNYGIISGWFGRNQYAYEHYKVEDKLINKPLVNIGGGMVLSRKVRELILESTKEIKYDLDIFAIITYVNGYENFEYRGSLLVHKSANGDKGYKAVERTMYHYYERFFPEYFNTYEVNNGKVIKLRTPYELYDISDYAKELHNKNKR